MGAQGDRYSTLRFGSGYLRPDGTNDDIRYHAAAGNVGIGTNSTPTSILFTGKRRSQGVTGLTFSVDGLSQLGTAAGNTEGGLTLANYATLGEYIIT